jgi:ubiquinone/menaquinone biosynthesis C-methylase UbiE
MSTQDGGPIDQTKRFSGLAERYAARRPDYPQAIFDALTAQLQATEAPRLALDVGCGTGISTRTLAGELPTWQVIGIEPNSDMLQQATADIGQATNLSYQTAPAETLPTENGSAGLLLAAQALHWFDRPRFYDEAARVLVPGGLLAILYNNRQTNDAPALMAVEDALEGANPAYNRSYRSFDIKGELATAGNYNDIAQHDEPWVWPIPLDAFVGYFMSRSFIKPILAERGLQETTAWLTGISAPFASEGQIDLPMMTTLTHAHRK